MSEFVSKLKGKKLHSQSREIIKNVYDFMKKEAQAIMKTGKCNDGFIVPIQKCQERTAAACGVSRTVVQTILQEAKKMGEDGSPTCSFSTPKKYKRDKPVTGIDDFDKCVVRRTVHEVYVAERRLPTADIIRKKLEEKINFKGSDRSLRVILKSLGFKWKATPSNRKVLIEKSDLRQKRIHYLKCLIKHREEKRPIVYVDESYILSSHVSSKSWRDDSAKCIHRPVSKGERLIIINAGGEMGCIPNCLLMWKAGRKSGDYHDQMNKDNYIKWLQEKLLPNLPPECVVVMDNAAYHNVEIHKAPTSNSKKEDMIKWLEDNSVPFSTNMLKPELLTLIKKHQSNKKTYVVDELLKAHGHTTLRLPPYHPDLNPIEMIWSIVKGHVAKHNTTFKMNDVIALCERKFAELSEDDWKPLCDRVKRLEREYCERDIIIDEETDRFVISLDSESDSDCEPETDSDADMCGIEMFSD